jgi:hypothetical protein
MFSGGMDEYLQPQRISAGREYWHTIPVCGTATPTTFCTQLYHVLLLLPKFFIVTIVKWPECMLNFLQLINKNSDGSKNKFTTNALRKNV